MQCSTTEPQEHTYTYIYIYIYIYIYRSQHLKWIKTFHEICPKTKTTPVLVLGQLTLIHFCDPLQMSTTVYKYTHKNIPSTQDLGGTTK